MDLLSKKDYTRYHQDTGSRMGYVILFVPVSAAWWEALRHESNLWREAMNKNVYIADEQTLFATLRIIRLTWTQIEQVNNHKKIFSIAEEMLNRVGQFMKHYELIGQMLDKAKDSYDNGSKKLKEKGQSIGTTAKKLIAMGAEENKKNHVMLYLDVDEVQQLPEPQQEDGVNVVESEGDGKGL